MDSNPKIASLASRLVEPNQPHRKRRDEEDESGDEDAIFAELEAEIENDDNSAIREQGLAALKQEMDRMQRMKDNHHGRYTEITEEREVVRVTANEPRCVVHFYHTNFKRCEIMDKHLAKLAPKYFNTRFSRVFVENIPWLVEKLQIKILPCVVCFVKGITKDRLIGFEELGNNDAFSTATLELRLAQTGVIQKSNEAKDLLYKVASTGKDDDDDVFDLE
ncbi:gtpase inhibitor [Moniliophthora roreri MCA 2997]|uniref:Gtpase inhibitor n=1 Tax=Moniliophthora roreri (strain MCA 2997) TaxID=1381753 RepID=V2YWQ9_MONRO|nr:gtpase inhibitor [Moniliophthora roreri MCA 2997]